MFGQLDDDMRDRQSCVLTEHVGGAVGLTTPLGRLVPKRVLLDDGGR